MKAIFTLLLTVGSLTSVLAQSHRDDRQQNNDYNRSVVSNHNTYQQPRGYHDPSNTTVWNNHNEQYHSDRERQQQVDQINHDYDRRINEYRNNRSMNNYERNRRINQLENERKSKLKSFAGGLILGGVLGVLLSH